jgi:hypothetical protein
VRCRRAKIQSGGQEVADRKCLLKRGDCAGNKVFSRAMPVVCGTVLLFDCRRSGAAAHERKESAGRLIVLSPLSPGCPRRAGARLPGVGAATAAGENLTNCCWLHTGVAPCLVGSSALTRPDNESAGERRRPLHQRARSATGASAAHMPPPLHLLFRNRLLGPRRRVWRPDWPRAPPPPVHYWKQRRRWRRENNKLGLVGGGAR